MLKLIATVASRRLRSLRILHEKNKSARQRRKRMIVVMKRKIASYYVDPVTARRILDRYETSIRPGLVYEMMKYHLLRVQGAEGRAEVKPQVSKLELDLFPKSLGVIRGKTTAVHVLDNR